MGPRKELEPYKGWKVYLMNAPKPEEYQIGLSVVAYGKAPGDEEITEIIVDVYYPISLWHEGLNKGDHPAVKATIQVMRDAVTNAIDRYVESQKYANKNRETRTEKSEENKREGEDGDNE